MTRRTPPKVMCRRCGKVVCSRVPNNKRESTVVQVRSHFCQHGVRCVWSASDGKQDEQLFPNGCGLCCSLKVIDIEKPQLATVLQRAIENAERCSST
jgi:uncharacterized cysteine cluster protein YcgN (CxxCxxCC family)